MELIDQGLENRVLTDKQLARVIKGSPQRRYGLVCLRKTSWQGLDWLTKGLRIDEDNLRSIKPSDIETLILVYKQKRVNSLLSSLARTLMGPPGHD
jgi:hypothetical protein